MRHRNTFIYIIKVWKEDPQDENWRGNIRNVHSGQSVSTSNMNELAGLIKRHFDRRSHHQPKQEKGIR
jgi:hypothetical protein